MRYLCIAVLLCGFWGSALAQSDSGVKEALVKADREFNTATQQHRLDGWMQFMDDNGVVYRGKPVVGRDAIRAELKPEWDDPSFNLTWEPDEAYPMPGGKMGYTRGKWKLTAKDEKGSPLEMTGQYLTIWRLTKEGQWKIVWDGGSADPPAKK